MFLVKPITPDQIAKLTKMREEVLALVIARCKETEVSDHHLVSMLAYTLGQTIAYCDQRKMTPEKIMAIVQSNIEAGNLHALTFATEMKPEGNA